MLFWLAALGFGLTAFSVVSFSKTPDGEPVDDWTRYDELFKFYANKNSIPWTWPKATALVESDLGRDARVARGEVSSDGKSYGLMQLRIETARDFVPSATIADLNRPEFSINVGCQYLGFLYRRYAGNEQKTIMSYNQGQGNTDKGKTYALGYYEKWKKQKARVEGRS